MDYLTQQNKILNCVADYYAAAISGKKIAALASRNFTLVSEKDDDSLMA